MTPKEIMETTANPSNDTQLAEAWGIPLEAAVCERCDWSYLLPAGSQPGVLQLAPMAGCRIWPCVADS